MHPKSLLRGAHAYLSPTAALGGLSAAHAASQPVGVPHSIAEIVAHMAFWQEWFLDRCAGKAVPSPASASLGWPKVNSGDWGFPPQGSPNNGLSAERVQNVSTTEEDSGGFGWRSQISNAGGFQPQWARDSTELFYIAPDRGLMAVGLSMDASRFEASAPKRLFDTSVPDLENARNRYAVTGDRQRFLINTLLSDQSDEPINVLVNWASGRNWWPVHTEQGPGRGTRRHVPSASALL